MSFERSPVVEQSPVSPNQTPIMREAREISPYSSQSRPAVAAPKETISGQSIINGDSRLPPAEPGAEVKEETITLSPQMAALARREQKARQRELEFKKREDALTAKAARVAELEALEEKLNKGDYSGLESKIQYDKYTNYLIEKEGKLSPEQQAIKGLETKLESLETSQKQDVEKRFEAAVRERTTAVNQLVETNPEFSSIKELKAEKAVVQLILDTWEHESVDLSPEEAAKLVEKELVERASKWSTLSKLKAQGEATPDAAKKELPPLKSQIKTLTNNMAASGDVKRQLRPLSQMSESERYVEARRRAEEKLKQREAR